MHVADQQFLFTCWQAHQTVSAHTISMQRLLWVVLYYCYWCFQSKAATWNANSDRLLLAILVRITVYQLSVTSCCLSSIHHIKGWTLLRMIMVVMVYCGFVLFSTSWLLLLCVFFCVFSWAWCVRFCCCFAFFLFLIKAEWMLQTQK